MYLQGSMTFLVMMGRVVERRHDVYVMCVKQQLELPSLSCSIGTHHPLANSNLLTCITHH